MRLKRKEKCQPISPLLSKQNQRHSFWWTNHWKHSLDDRHAQNVLDRNYHNSDLNLTFGITGNDQSEVIIFPVEWSEQQLSSIYLWVGVLVSFDGDFFQVSIDKKFTIFWVKTDGGNQEDQSRMQRKG